MSSVDKKYAELLIDIKKNGVKKNTRAGETISTFGHMLTFNMNEGFPLITTKKMFTKGIIQELIWFINGGTNIRPLVENNVHIWDGDAYRYYTEKVKKNNSISSVKKYDIISKESFINCTLNNEKIKLCKKKNRNGNPIYEYYQFGDVGKIYGYQWNSFNGSYINQLDNIIDTLKTNPNDRRMLCIAFNPAQLDEMALPPCHVMFQVYTRPLTEEEKNRNGSKEYAISLLWTQRSVDTFLGLPFNIASYAILLSMIAQCVDMVPDKLICSLGDTHLYTNHMDAVNKQLSRDTDMFKSPILKLNPLKKNLLSFTSDDIVINDYESFDKIKADISVG